MSAEAPRVAMRVVEGDTTIREWRTPPVQVPTRVHYRHDQFAVALGEALGRAVPEVEGTVVGQTGVGGRFARYDVILLHAFAIDIDLLVEAGEADALRRVLVFDATLSDLVLVVRHGMLGGITVESLRAWREDPGGEIADGLFGYTAVAGREPAGLVLDPRRGRRGDYAFLTSARPRTVPELVADYLRAWTSGAD